MNSFIQADIFFVITSFAVILLTILFAIVIIYLIQILKNFRDISNILKNGTKSAKGSIEKLKKNLKKNFPFNLE